MTRETTLEAYAVQYGDGYVTLFKDRPTAEQLIGILPGSKLHKLIDERAVALKFDGYVPADQVSSLRWRVIELEDEIRLLRGEGRQTVQRDGNPADPPAFPPTVEVEWQGKPFQPLPVRNKLPVPEVTVITDPAAISAAFAKDDDVESEGGLT